MTVDRDGVVVVLPRGARPERADQAVERLDGWIRARLAERDSALSTVAARGPTLPWLGRTLDLVPEAGRAQARLAGDRILVPDGDHRPALERLIRREARIEIGSRLERVTAECGHGWQSLRIGDMKTRWASCSKGGRFSFSWRLMLAPDEVLETIVWHEVAHLDEPNHSARFWQLMDRRRPGHREHAAWLRRHAAELAL